MNEHREKNFFDLVIAFCNWIKKGCKELISLICNCVRLTYQYWYAVLLGLALVFAIAFYVTGKEKRVFKGEAVMVFAPEARAHVISHLDYLSTLLHNPKLAELMDVSYEYADKITKIRHFNVIDFKDDNVQDVIEHKKIGTFVGDTMNVYMNDRLAVKIYLRSDTDFDRAIKGLEHYFASCPDICAIDSVRREMVAGQIEFLKQEEQRVDSLSNYRYFKQPHELALKANSSILLSEPEREDLYYVDMKKIRSIRHEFEVEQSLRSGVVTFLSPMPIVTFPRPWAMGIAVVAGYIFGLILALLVKYRKNIHEFLKKK